MASMPVYLSAKSATGCTGVSKQQGKFVSAGRPAIGRTSGAGTSRSPCERNPVEPPLSAGLSRRWCSAHGADSDDDAGSERSDDKDENEDDGNLYEEDDGASSDGDGGNGSGDGGGGGKGGGLA